MKAREEAGRWDEVKERKEREIIEHNCSKWTKVKSRGKWTTNVVVLEASYRIGGHVLKRLWSDPDMECMNGWNGWISGGWTNGVLRRMIWTRDRTGWTNITDLDLERGHTLLTGFEKRDIRACDDSQALNEFWIASS